MSFFKNKHVITAMIVAPILAVLSYYAVDLMVKEQPRAAVEGQAYELVAKSNCRYSSGECDLVNGDFKSTITVQKGAAENSLQLKSVHALDAVTVGFVSEDGGERGPVKLTPSDDTRMIWKANFKEPADASTLLRVVLNANATNYYSETTMGFSNYETSFERDFRKQQSDLVDLD